MRRETKILSHMFLLGLFMLLFTTCEKFDKEPPVNTEIRPTHLSGVSTITVSEITTESAICVASVNFIGSDSVLSKGICFSENPMPTIDDSLVNSGLGKGEFTAMLQNLNPATDYYIRAFAYSDAGYSYGEENSFTTLPLTVPDLKIDTVCNITYESAICTATVTYDGGTDVFASGICISTTTLPDINNILFNEESSFEDILIEISSLEPHTIYYIRAYAQNEIGIAYSDEEMIITDWLNCGLVQDNEGNTYQTVTIGEQCWLRSNLRTNHYNNGDYIYNIIESENWENTTNGAYCFYSNQDQFVQYFGNIYNGYAVSDSRGICPIGWRVATDDDWKQLEEGLGISVGELDNTGWRGTDEGGLLKQEGTELWSYPNVDATNETGFSSTPGGFRSSTGEYLDSGYSSIMWTSTENGTAMVYRSLSYGDARIYRNLTTKNNGFSVRCIKE